MENMLAPISPADLIAASHEAVDAIKTAAGLTDRQFAALCMPVLRAYADHVQSLPLTAAVFGTPRGAWDFGLTAAMIAYRYAGTVIFFPTLGAEERRVLEPQCRYMAFLATLSTAVAMVAEAASITAGDDEYHPLSTDTTLFGWLSEHRQSNFAWRVPATPLSAQAGAAIAAKFIPRGLLANFDLRAVLVMYEAITPKTTMNGVESTLARAVRLSVQGVLEHYRAKQAASFQPGASEPSVTPADAEKLASKMIAAANPTVIANPLETPAALRPASHQAELAPSGAAAPAMARPEPAADFAETGAAPAPTHGSQLAGPAHVAPPNNAAAVSEGDILERAPKVLREWFSALAQHPQFPALKDQLVMNAEGIEVPVSMLGMFGISGASIRQMMNEAGLIIRRSDNARGVILHPALRDRFVTQ
jgi:hypothetical protein